MCQTTNNFDNNFLSRGGAIKQYYTRLKINRVRIMIVQWIFSRMNRVESNANYHMLFANNIT